MILEPHYNSHANRRSDPLRVHGSPMRVYITVDTETSMGGAWRNPSARPLPLAIAVYGKLGSRSYGIPLLMDIMEAHGMRGTFFTELFCGYVLGFSEVEGVLDYTIRRGHDAQLHLHPVYWHYSQYLEGGEKRAKDLMWDRTAEEQDDLIGRGVELFRKFTGAPPRAYRAGCYGASETTLATLLRHGIEIDSSYNLCYLGQTCRFEGPLLNGPCRIGGVGEFPVTCFRAYFPSGYKPLEVGAVSVSETISTIRSLREAGCRDVVLSLHSFSFLKNMEGPPGRCRPDRLVIRRFEKLCRWLASTKEVECAVLGNAALPGGESRSDYIPTVGMRHSMARRVTQGVNRIPWI